MTIKSFTFSDIFRPNIGLIDPDPLKSEYDLDSPGSSGPHGTVKIITFRCPKKLM